jgi:hypothetical protein
MEYGVVREHQLYKEVQPLPFYQRRNNERRKNNIKQIYGHGSQRGSMPGVTVLWMLAVSYCSVLPCSSAL